MLCVKKPLYEIVDFTNCLDVTSIYYYQYYYCLGSRTAAALTRCCCCHRRQPPYVCMTPKVCGHPACCGQENHSFICRWYTCTRKTYTTTGGDVVDCGLQPDVVRNMRAHEHGWPRQHIPVMESLARGLSCKLRPDSTRLYPSAEHQVGPHDVNRGFTTLYALS